MVSYNPRHWFSIIFQLHKSDTARQLFPTSMALALVVGVFCYVDMEWFGLRVRGTMVMHSLIGFVISMLLVFRTNTAYERWWEGRKHWGALVNSTRTMALRLTTIIPQHECRLNGLFHALLVSYVRSLKEHLRQGVGIKDLYKAQDFGFADVLLKKHVPNAIAEKIYLELAALKTKGHISEQQLLAMDIQFTALQDISGACERIKKTPIPYSYSAFIKKFIFLYVITLPVALVAEMGYAAVPVTVFVFYILASLELIAEEIEDPFGRDANDLPTDEIAHTIESNLTEILLGKNIEV